jgi:hypothetical protein
VARVLALLLSVAVLVHLPWAGLRRTFGVVTEVEVEGTRYLDAARVVEVAGIHPGDDLFAVSLSRARQALLLEPRVARARLSRRLPRGIRVEVEERVPVLLVSHGVPWELDAGGVLLAPLEHGVVADVPLLVGGSFERLPAGAHVVSPEVRRGLAWVRTLAERELQLCGEVSEVDVSDLHSTGLTLVTGTRVLAPAWPPSVRRLSALRVVLADLKQRGTTADELDLRFENQVIVRPAARSEDAHSG